MEHENKDNENNTTDNDTTDNDANYIDAIDDADHNDVVISDGDITFIFGRGSDSISLDTSVPTDGESIYVTNQIYDTLVQYEEDGTEVEESLATNWDVSDDNLVWTFELRDDVTFHDGTDFTAEDVVFNFE